MESLGFFEDTVTRTTSWTTGAVTAVPVAQAVAVVEPQVDPFDTWEVTAVEKRLVTGKIRWSSIIGVLMILAGIAGIAAWFYQRPVELTKDALADLSVSAQALEPALLSLQQANNALTEGTRPVSVTATLLELDDLARDLFSSSAALPQTQTRARSRAADAASDALDASRLLGDSVAFQAAVIPVLALPEFITDPNLIALDEAARSFGAWQARFDGVRSALPDGVMSAVTVELGVISGDLGATQSRYLDALRSDDPSAAVLTLGELSARLEGAYGLLTEGIVETQAKVSARIASALAAIDSLVG